ncbi:hypothetical protein G9A89_015494 [Geosiphon pyriformis]|nr:hypothetical protein G9A89_015494 [Geosiphon pyriformis]
MYDKSKPFLLDYETIVGPSVAVIKESAKSFSADTVSKDIASRKKRKGGVLKDDAAQKMVVFNKVVGSSWESKAEDTTESNNVNMEEEFLIEKISVDYGKGDFLEGRDVNQTPKGPKVVTKQALDKPLGKINFLSNNNNGDVLSGDHLELPPSLRNLVNVPVHKSFALDIGLEKVTGKFSQEKLSAVKKLFSGINSFGRASIPSKFAGIIRVMFTSKLSLAQASKKAENAKIMVNTNLKKSASRSNWAVVLKEIPVGTSAEAVRAALSKFGIIKSIKMQLVGLWQKAVIEFKQLGHADLVTAKWSILIGKDAVQHRALLYTLPMGMTAHNIWDFIGSVGGKTCVINCYLVIYARAKCAVICFDSAELLDAIVRTTPVLRGTNLCWFCLVSAKCAKCEKSGYTSLGCAVGGKVSSGLSLCRVLSDTDKSRLAAIYAKRSAPVACPVSFGGLSWAKVASEFSFLPLSGHNVLAKSGSSSEMKPFLPVLTEVNDRFVALERSLASLAEQVGKLAKRLDALGPTVSQPSPGSDIVMSEGSGAATSGKVVSGVMSFNVSLHEMSDGNSSESFGQSEQFWCRFKFFFFSMNNLVWNIATCNIRGINNPAKQNDIICWHMKRNNLISIFTESKLKEKICPWIVNKFNSVQVFTSGLESGYLGASVMVVMNSSLGRHVCRVSEVLGWLLSIKLLFKNKLSVSILGLYAGASSAVWFSQADEVNSLIAKAVNESSFIVLSGDFNKDGSSNSRSVMKTIDYVFVSPNLVNAIVNCEVLDVSEHFDTDHQAVLMAVGLGGLLDMHFKDATLANATMFSDEFAASARLLDLNIMVLSTGEVFKKKWFKKFNDVFTKDSLRFHKLELLVSKIIKASCVGCAMDFASLMKHWASVDNVNASIIQNLMDSGMESGCVHSALLGVRKSYWASKLVESQSAKEANIRSAISRRIESFEMNKGHMIRSVLECLFRKIMLNHLVVNDELVLEPDLVKSKVDVIMEGWTRKHQVVDNILVDWHHQYQLLEYVFDKAFSGVMCPIGYDEFFRVVSELPNGKAAGLSGISNEL